MSINFDNFPTFSEEHFHTWINELTPIEEHKGYLVKRDDLFNLGGVSGGKVRQCSKLVFGFECDQRSRPKTGDAYGIRLKENWSGPSTSLKVYLFLLMRFHTKHFTPPCL